MAWNFRKSVKVGPFRLNLSKRGVGWSVGVPGFRTGVDSRGRKYDHVSIPGTGIYSRTYHGNQVSQQSPSPTRAIKSVRHSQPIRFYSKNRMAFYVFYVLGFVGLLISSFSFVSDAVAGWACIAASALLAQVFAFLAHAALTHSKGKP